MHTCVQLIYNVGSENKICTSAKFFYFIWTVPLLLSFVVFYILFYILCCVHLLSNVFFDMLRCNIESCGIVCMLLIRGRLFRVFRRWNKEVVRVVLVWVLFFLLLHPVFFFITSSESIVGRS